MQNVEKLSPMCKEGSGEKKAKGFLGIPAEVGKATRLTAGLASPGIMSLYIYYQLYCDLLCDVVY